MNISINLGRQTKFMIRFYSSIALKAPAIKLMPDFSLASSHFTAFGAGQSGFQESNLANEKLISFQRCQGDNMLSFNV